MATALRSLSRSREAERCFLCRSPTLRPWITDRLRRICSSRRPTWRSFGARASYADLGNDVLKPTLIVGAHFLRAAPRVFLSQAGPRFDLVLFKLSITFRFDVD